MAELLKYPRDVVKEFLERDKAKRERTDIVLREIFGEFPKEKDAPLSKKDLRSLVETMLFASMATEEGHIQPVGVVFARSRDDFESEDEPWVLYMFESPRTLGVRDVTKLAATCDFPRSFLAVMPIAGELKIVGIAAPSNQSAGTYDRLVRVMAPQPGTIVMFRGRAEVVRYSRGSIPPRPPDFLELCGGKSQQVALIVRSVFGLYLPKNAEIADVEGFVFAEIRSVVSMMSRLGHGGLLAVLGPHDDGGSLLKSENRLRGPMGYGSALNDNLNARAARMPKARRGPDAGSADPSGELLKSIRKQLVRLSAVDGAVLLSNSLQVLGFGVKLVIRHEENPLEVRTVAPDGTPGERWDLHARGARHRAAATFAQQHPDGLAFIVSQDGDAAMFQSRGDHVAYWPLGVPIEASL
ncbi:putative sensor domain DACNV-containing protein [Corallococcus sp. CA053C]|uniref:putative sensor domain DACNV-containing protein n=1 Tax=Corallococcus sp. CA053C TaxID=2316732 RepID=UPI0013154CEC|nr:diadenylate cyclase [Corallococcus sp. CA053C]